MRSSCDEALKVIDLVGPVPNVITQCPSRTDTELKRWLNVTYEFTGHTLLVMMDDPIPSPLSLKAGAFERTPMSGSETCRGIDQLQLPIRFDVFRNPAGEHAVLVRPTTT